MLQKTTQENCENSICENHVTLDFYGFQIFIVKYFLHIK